MLEYIRSHKWTIRPVFVCNNIKGMQSNEVFLVVLFLEDEGTRLSVEVIVLATIQQGLCLLELSARLLRLLRRIVNVFLLICATNGLGGSLLKCLSLVHAVYYFIMRSIKFHYHFITLHVRKGRRKGGRFLGQ